MVDSLLSQPSDDPGGDTQRRMRYQNAYGMILLVGILSGIEDAVAIYFEQYEDLLIQLRNGRFIAVQVKTKEPPSPLKSTDAAVIKSLQRFLALEDTHPRRIEKFKIVSSSGFFKDGTARDLHAVLADVKSAIPGDLLKLPLTKPLCKKLIPPATEVVAHRVLSLVEPVADAPGLNDIESRLRHILSDLDFCEDALPYQISNAVERLIGMALRAASYRPEGLNYDAISIMKGSDAANHALVNAKRILPEQVREVIAECLSTAVTRDALLPKTSDSDNAMLRKKMSVAGVPARNIDTASDLAFHARFQLQVNKQRLGRFDAKARDAHLRAIVHSEFDKEFERLIDRGELDGRRLYGNMRSICERLPKQRDVSGADHEELFGLTAVLTDECKLWWTLERRIPDPK